MNQPVNDWNLGKWEQSLKEAEYSYDQVKQAIATLIGQRAKPHLNTLANCIEKNGTTLGTNYNGNDIPKPASHSEWKPSWKETIETKESPNGIANKLVPCNSSSDYLAVTVEMIKFYQEDGDKMMLQEWEHVHKSLTEHAHEVCKAKTI